MRGASLGPIRVLTKAGGIADLACGVPPADPLADLEDRLPRPNSLRRAGAESKLVVLAAWEALREARVEREDRLGAYIGLQRGALDYCTEFINQSYREGPRMASPMLFSESVANNVATHLSLTLGLQGIVETFIGTRVAGLQALAAAREDLEARVAETALVVVLHCGARVMSDAYHALFSPRDRRCRPPALPFLDGAAALLARQAAKADLTLGYVGVRCFGPSFADQARAIRSLWEDCRSVGETPERLVPSTFLLVRSRALEAIRAGLGVDSGLLVPPSEGLEESFALDPFLQLLVDQARAPGPGRRGVICLSDEGTAGLLTVA